MNRLLLGLLLSSASLGLAAAADEAPAAKHGQTYARHLAQVARAAHGEVAGIVIRAAPVAGQPAVVAGANPAEPTRGVTLDVPIVNVSGDPIGVATVTFAKPGDHKAAGAAIQAYIGKRVLSAKNLMDPYPFNPSFAANTYAQALVDSTMRKHPELLVFAIHATPPHGKTNVIIGSNIGRIGKPADEDDLRVIEKGTTNLEVAEAGNRFEVEAPLNDAKGHRIGALGMVFAYKAGDDKAALNARADAIRDALAKEIPTSAALFKAHGQAK